MTQEAMVKVCLPRSLYRVSKWDSKEQKDPSD